MTSKTLVFPQLVFVAGRATAATVKMGLKAGGANISVNSDGVGGVGGNNSANINVFNNYFVQQGKGIYEGNIRSIVIGKMHKQTRPLEAAMCLGGGQQG
jgi:hypothetical protein